MVARRNHDLDPKIAAMIRHKARLLAGCRGFLRRDEADLRQELAAHVVERMRRHDPARGSAHTYADRVLATKVTDLVRRARAQRRDRFREERLEHPPPRTLDQLHEHAATLAGQEELRHDLADTLASLPEHDCVTALLLAEAPLAAVARATGRSRQQVRTARQRIRGHLEKAGWADGK